MQTHSVTTSSLITELDKFVEEAAQYRGFLLQCSMYFAAQEGATNQEKVAQFINLLTGYPMGYCTLGTEQWGHANLWTVCLNVSLCVDHVPYGNEIGESLLDIQQGCPVACCWVCTQVPDSICRKWMESACATGHLPPWTECRHSNGAPLPWQPNHPQRPHWSCHSPVPTHSMSVQGVRSSMFVSFACQSRVHADWPHPAQHCRKKEATTRGLRFLLQQYWALHLWLPTTS